MDAAVCLITGASSGIGEALALEHAKRGYHVVVLGRRLDRLEALAAQLSAHGREALALACDVTVEGAIEDAVRATLARFGRLDLAIANAGISIDGAFEQTTLSAQRQVMETNYFGMLRTAYACFDPLRASKGRFAAVGSVSGFVCVPGFTAYTASKFAVRGFLGTLEVEWARHGIAVTHIAPGFVESEIRTKRADGSATRDPIPPWVVMKAPAAARAIADALAARRPEVVVTAHGKVIVQVARHAPRTLAALLHAARSKVPGFGKKR
jgi:short-subunit dehydrogenase